MKSKLLQKKLELLDKLLEESALLDQNLCQLNLEQAQVHMESRNSLLQEYSTLDQSGLFQTGGLQQANVVESDDILHYNQLIREKLEILFDQMKKHDLFLRNHMQNVKNLLQELDQRKNASYKYAKIFHNNEARFLDMKE